MALRKYFAFITACALCSSVPIFARHRDVAPLIGGARGGAAPLGDEKLAAEILDSIQKSGAEVGVAFRTLEGKAEWFSHADARYG
jgi:hypothetical protein